MSPANQGPVPHPFFIEQSGRRLFAVHHPPTGPGAVPTGVVFLPPFAEEMNRSRRMATLLSQASAAVGADALVFDLSGTGDSSDEFATARWEMWREDTGAAIDWLSERTGGPVALVALRLGAHLALDAARSRPADIASIVLWQPVTSGRTMLTQFLRVRTAAAMTRDVDNETTQSLWARLAAGETVDIAGYDIAPGLGQAIETLNLDDPPPPEIPVHWLDLVPEAGRETTPASRRVIDRWREAGISIAADTVVGEPFWSIQETTVAPALIDTTVELLAGRTR